MQNINGKIAFRGIAIGKIKEISKETNVPFITNYSRERSIHLYI